LLLEVISVTAGTADFSSENLTALVAIENNVNNTYNVITLKLGLTYEGTEISDDFTASTGLGVSQDSGDWIIEYLNGTEEWTSVMNVEMGIGLDNNDTAQLLYREVDVRITLPLQNQTRTINGGHAVNMRFVSDGGMSEASVRVSVPQQYNISLEGAPEEIGVADGGETTVTLVVSNFGNGDDLTTVIAILEQDCIDDGWEVTPPISNITVTPDNVLSQSFTIHAGVNSTELTCNVDFTADSSGEFDTQTDSTNAMISVAKLSIITKQIEPFAADAIANTAGIIRIPIENEGFLTATDVIVVLVSAQTGTEFAEQQVTISVPAEGVGYAEFAYSNMPPGNAHLKVMVTVVGTPVSEDVPDYEFKIKFSNLAESEESPFLMVVIVALTILVLYGGFKTARKGSSGRF
ncbi:MAG: hypothetical protein OR994_08175, partial [Candidatus Poseidoniales archaeon]|nr:hypothetical protein [Candidatus Poseidoniales archaeon]